MIRRLLSILVLLGLSLALVPSRPAFATEQVADLKMTVKAGLKDDNSPIEGAEITILPGRHQVKTNALGEAEVVSLPLGTYTVRIAAPGWKTVEVSQVDLDQQTQYIGIQYMNKGAGEEKVVNRLPNRTGPMTLRTSETKIKEFTPAELKSAASTQDLYLNFQAPKQIYACDASGSSCQYVETETLVKQILWKEWGDVKPEYHSSNWPLESLKAGAVAIRSWLYFHASPHAPWGCKRSSCKVNQSEEDLVWMTIAPTFPATYTSAMLESSNIYIWYNYYYDELLGAYIRKPADAMFADRTGHWSKDGSLNADGSNNGKVYLQSHESPPDQFVESYRPAGYAPGMSQRGTKDWIVGFIDGTGTLRKMQSYGQLLSYHYPGTGTAMARY